MSKHLLVPTDGSPLSLRSAKAAKASRCDLIFMASHGRRGIAAVLIGSENHKVLTHCKVPVLVYR